MEFKKSLVRKPGQILKLIIIQGVYNNNSDIRYLYKKRYR